MTNIVEIDTLRKIKGLEKVISDYKKLLHIKENYLNKLQSFSNYDSIKVEIGKVQNSVTRLTFHIGMYEQTLERLRKEV